MIPKFDAQFKNIEQQKSDMLKVLRSMSANELQQRPSPSDWSPLEILEHIVIVEEWTAGPNEEPLPEHARVMLKGHLFVAFVSRFMRSGIRAPTDPRAIPSGHRDIESLVRRWDQSRELFKAKLEKVQMDALERPISMHTIAGPLDANRVLTLVDVHLSYHLRQLQKL